MRIPKLDEVLNKKAEGYVDTSCYCSFLGVSNCHAYLRAEILLNFLKIERVKHVFGIPAGPVLLLYDALRNPSKAMFRMR